VLLSTKKPLCMTYYYSMKHRSLGDNTMQTIRQTKLKKGHHNLWFRRSLNSFCNWRMFWRFWRSWKLKARLVMYFRECIGCSVSAYLNWPFSPSLTSRPYLSVANDLAVLGKQGQVIINVVRGSLVMRRCSFYKQLNMSPPVIPTFSFQLFFQAEPTTLPLKSSRVIGDAQV
jgi:hypothetical protein